MDGLEKEEDSRGLMKRFFFSQCARLSKGILRENSDTSLSGGSSSKKVTVSVNRDVMKPITKWRRICKCFIGLKMTKKNKVIKLTSFT